MDGEAYHIGFQLEHTHSYLRGKLMSLHSHCLAYSTTLGTLSQAFCQQDAEG